MDGNRELTQSEKEYRQLKEAKKRLRAALRNYNQTYQRVQSAFLRNTDAYARSLRRMDDPETAKALDASFQALSKSTEAHIKALEELNAAPIELLDTERGYIFGVIHRLKEKYGLLDAEIADVFGIYQTSLSRWLSADKQRRAEICEAEMEGTPQQEDHE